MRHFVSASAETTPVGVVDVARWDQYSLDGTMPFGAMWYTIPPGGAGPPDCHPDLELSLVISGTATVEAGGKVTEVSPGGAFLLDANEAHVISNRSDAEPLLVFSAYWMPVEPDVAESAVAEPAVAKEEVAEPAVAEREVIEEGAR